MTDHPPGERLQPANDAQERADDVRDQLRRDHEWALAELGALREEGDATRALARLQQLRRAWVIHTLAEETVVYPALEEDGAAHGGPTERFIEHELVGELFDKLTRARPGSLEWRARLAVARDLMSRHVESEQDELFERLASRHGANALRELGARFALEREKLERRDEPKAA